MNLLPGDVLPSDGLPGIGDPMLWDGLTTQSEAEYVPAGLLVLVVSVDHGWNGAFVLVVVMGRVGFIDKARLVGPKL